MLDYPAAARHKSPKMFVDECPLSRYNHECSLLQIAQPYDAAVQKEALFPNVHFLEVSMY